MLRSDIVFLWFCLNLSVALLKDEVSKLKMCSISLINVETANLLSF